MTLTGIQGWVGLIQLVTVYIEAVVARLSVWYKRPDREFLENDLVWLQERLFLVNRVDYQETVRLITSVTLGVVRGRILLAGKVPPPLPEYDDLEKEQVVIWRPDKWWEQVR